MTIPRPSAAALRHAARMTLAALIASELTTLLGLPQGYWAVITTLIVVQGSVGGTLGAATDRVLATMAGACVGVAGAWLQVATPLPLSIVLVIVSAPLAMLASQRPSFRLAPVTAAMILMMGGGSGEDALWTALDRLLEIGVGCVIGVLTAHFVLPSRAREVIIAEAATLLDAYGAVAQAYLMRREDAHVDGLQAQIRGLVTRIAAAAAEESRERTVHLATGVDIAPLVRTLRRLRSDVVILGRLAAMPGAPVIDHTAVADGLKAQFDHFAQAVRGMEDPPTLGTLDALIGEQLEGGTLHFALITLRRDLEDLGERLRELAGTRA